MLVVSIRHEVTLPYTPRHNGLVHRRNITILDMARSMLNHKNMAHMFWCEATKRTTYILNKWSTKKLKMKVLEKAWSGRKPGSKHLNVFGSICFYYVLGSKKKMDVKIKIMEFIGYQSTYAYKLYYPLDKRVHIRRYMIFNETWACKSEDILDKGSDINHFFWRTCPKWRFIWRNWY